MSVSNRGMRGGPSGASGKLPEGARLVTPAQSKAQAERMRSTMTPNRPSSGRLMQERLNLTFFQEAVAELRKVHWPTREQARNLTLLVIGVSLSVGMILGAMDYIFSKLFELILRIGGA
jgi:preprotein translocase subunit SecE